jgi:PAS domain S-box-containing protein
VERREDGRTEAEVRESEARLSTLVEATLEAVVIHDEGRILDVNRAFTEMTGYEREEAIGMTVADLVHPASHAAMLADAESRRDGPRDYLVRTRNGRVRCAEFAVRSCTYQGQRVRVAVARDVTEERAAAAALRASEERFQVVARATNDAIWEADLGTGVFTRGATFAQLFGYRPEDVGSDETWWWERVHPDDQERVRAGLEASRAAGADVHADEYRFRRGDGSFAHVFDRVVVMRGEDGAPSRIIGAMMDITERKRMEQKLIVADRLASLGTLAAGVAHEINNPLSYVIANVRLVEAQLRRLAGDAADHAVRGELGAAAAALDEAREGAERVHRIVAELKTFSRADEEDRRGPVDVASVLTAAVHLAEHELRRRARVVLAVAALPPVLASEARLGQVILTLLVHAAESIPEGAPEAHEIRVAARLGDDGRAHIEVSDTGHGLSPEARGRVFDPFFSARAPDEPSGLGLSMGHALVTGMGGELLVESELGKGSTFRITLPLSSAPEAAPPAPAAPEAAPTAPRAARVLVVDDEPMVGRMVERALGAVHRVQSVTSGQRALDLLVAGERFDVILCDLMMPAMSGIDLHERIRALAPEQADRMVFLSGGAFTRRAREFLELHPSLDKPFDLQALEATIQARLR